MVADVDGQLVVVSLDSVERFLPLAQTVLQEQPALRDAVKKAIPGFGPALDLFVSIGDISGFAAASVRERLRQEDAEKLRVAAPRFQELDDELGLVTDLIAALKEGIESLPAFPPVWLDGGSSSTTDMRFEMPPLWRPADWALERPASTYAESCWRWRTAFTTVRRTAFDEEGPLAKTKESRFLIRLSATVRHEVQQQVSASASTRCR